MTGVFMELAPLLTACGCWQVGAAAALQRVAPECIKSAQDTSAKAEEAHSKGSLALQHTKDVAAVLQGLSGGLDMDDFRAIKGMVEEKKARKAYKIFKDMDDMALEMMGKTKSLTNTLDEAAREVMPDNAREDDTNITTRGGVGGEEQLSIPDEEAQALVGLLGHADSDVEQVRSNTRSVEQVDVFNAGSTGGQAFERVAGSVENVALKIFHEVRSVSDTIMDTLVMGAAGDSSLCAMLTATASGMAALTKALRLSKLIEKAIEVVRRILAELLSFINTSWDKFQKFFDQFDAGKKLKRWSSGIKNSLTDAFGK